MASYYDEQDKYWYTCRTSQQEGSRVRGEIGKAMLLVFVLGLISGAILAVAGYPFCVCDDTLTGTLVFSAGLVAFFTALYDIANITRRYVLFLRREDGRYVFSRVAVGLITIAIWCLLLLIACLLDFANMSVIKIPIEAMSIGSIVLPPLVLILTCVLVAAILFGTIYWHLDTYIICEIRKSDEECLRRAIEIPGWEDLR